MSNDIKPSNSQLADQVSTFAAALFFELRGYGLSIAEQVDIGNAAYAQFNHATVVQARNRVAA